MPIYATKLTNGLIENKLKEHNLLTDSKTQGRKVRTVYQSGRFPCRIYQDQSQYRRMQRHWLSTHRQVLWCTPVTLRWITHRYLVMPSICSVSRELGKKGVLALMCDSTNAERHGLYPVRAYCRKDDLRRFLRNTQIPASSSRRLRPM